MSISKKNSNLLDRLSSQGIGSQELEEVRAIMKSHDESLSAIEGYKAEVEKFKMMADWSPCTISWIKSDHTYAGVNKTLSDLFDIDPEEFVGKEVGFNSDYAYFLDFSKSLFESDQSSLSTEISAVIEERERKFYLVGTKFRNDEQAIIIGLDVTELSSLKESVALMERLSSLGEMVAGIVHEVNNPLTVIQNKGRLALKQLEKGELEKVSKSIETIGKTCVKMGKIVEGVKSFVRKADQDPDTTVYLHETLLEAKALLHSKFSASNVSLKLPKGAGPVVTGNQTQLYQVFINLMTNSIDAIEDCEEKWIEVETKALDDDKVEILFKDSGNGIGEEAKEKIFQSFYTTKAPGKGTGLGLSLCKKIVERHGGSLEIEEDEHTCFKITLAA